MPTSLPTPGSYVPVEGVPPWLVWSVTVAIPFLLALLGFYWYFVLRPMWDQVKENRRIAAETASKAKTLEVQNVEQSKQMGAQQTQLTSINAQLTTVQGTASEAKGKADALASVVPPANPQQ